VSCHTHGEKVARHGVQTVLPCGTIPVLPRVLSLPRHPRVCCAPHVTVVTLPLWMHLDHSVSLTCTCLMNSCTSPLACCPAGSLFICLPPAVAHDPLAVCVLCVRGPVTRMLFVHRRGPSCPVRQLFTGGSLVIRPAVVHRQGTLCPSVRQFLTGGGPSDPSGSCSPVGASASVGSCSGQMSLSCG
jgi:hypothetical protein